MSKPRRVPGWYVRNDNDLYRRLYESAQREIDEAQPTVRELARALALVIFCDYRGGKVEAITDAMMQRYSLAPIVGSDGKVWATSDGWRERA